ncbi:hypothetical protein M422DRAFT_785922 [Sphaerobolus stellatus SS14]|uniref:Uncharacterized protein n=1 Tax=Sphaerobolus stellatus (strain SS14) TaxID=990650 RepID=A0A0C9UG57_SPHS4|nr:hypothetical protein M422DRAFT_785922 [Sphaerobolus stellatus SS14]
MHELVAPRPLRFTAAPAFALRSPTSSPRIRRRPSVRLIAAPTDTFARISLADGGEDSPALELERSPSALDDVEGRRDTTSPRLSQDALEEFLSILQPVMFATPSSPILRTRYDRPIPYRPWSHVRSRSSASVSGDDSARAPERAVGTTASEERDELGEELIFDPRPWPSFLSSPVSRMHTQNPLARCVSHDFDVNTYYKRTATPPISSPAILSLAQSIPIPSTPPAIISRVSTPLIEV